MREMGESPSMPFAFWEARRIACAAACCADRSVPSAAENCWACCCACYTKLLRTPRKKFWLGYMTYLLLGSKIWSDGLDTVSALDYVGLE